MLNASTEFMGRQVREGIEYSSVSTVMLVIKNCMADFFQETDLSNCLFFKKFLSTQWYFLRLGAKRDMEYNKR